MKIQKTKDLSIFKISDKNREIKNNSRLEEIILKNNHLHSNPIIVDKDYFVVDGQHRLEIAKKHGLEIYYIVDEKADETTCAILNQARKNWTPIDFVDHYAKQGNETFKFIKECCEIFNIAIDIFVRNFCLGANINSSRKYQNQNTQLRFSKEEILSQLKKYQLIFNKVKEICNLKYHMFNGAYFRAILRIVRHEDFDLQRMIRKIDKNISLVEKSLRYRKTEDSLKVLEEIYNRNEQKEKHLYF